MCADQEKEPRKFTFFEIWAAVKLSNTFLFLIPCGIVLSLAIITLYLTD